MAQPSARAAAFLNHEARSTDGPPSGRLQLVPNITLVFENKVGNKVKSGTKWKSPSVPQFETFKGAWENIAEKMGGTALLRQMKTATLENGTTVRLMPIHMPDDKINAFKQAAALQINKGVTFSRTEVGFRLLGQSATNAATSNGAAPKVAPL